jgi:hypothetical protein
VEAGRVADAVDIVARRLAGMVDVVARCLTGVVDEDDAVKIIAGPEDETHDGERSRHNKVVEVYFRSAVMLWRKKPARK